MSLLVCVTMKAQECERYIEVTGTSEMAVVPDEIHYLIEIQEYFEEEFDGVSKLSNTRRRYLLPGLSRN